MAKDLFLIRHAKSSWKNLELGDHARPLNKRGRHDAPLMAKILRKSSIMPDVLITSSAVRARSTAEVFAEEFGIKKKKIVIDDELYMAGNRDFIKTLSAIDDVVQTAFLFSHNPGITDFANLLCGSDVVNIPTCGVFHTRIIADKWTDLRPGECEFISLDFPKNHY